MKKDDLIELIAQTIYCDSFTQYGTCDIQYWEKTSENQRIFCKNQARAVLSILELHNLIRKID